MNTGDRQIATPVGPDRAPGAPTRLVRALFLDLTGVLLDTAPQPGLHGCQPGRESGSEFSSESSSEAGSRPSSQSSLHAGLCVTLRAGAGVALRLLDRLDYRILVLTPCIHDRRRAGAIAPARVAHLLARERIDLAGACCLHTGCDTTKDRLPATALATQPAAARAENAPIAGACRGCQPAPAMLLHTACELGIDLAASWLLAGSAAYCLAGRQAGCQTLQIVGEDAHWHQSASRVDTASAHMQTQTPSRARDVIDAALVIARLDADRAD